MFGRINLLQELQKEKERIKHQEDRLLKESNDILKAEEEHDKEISKRLLNQGKAHGQVPLNNLPATNIFSIEELRNICSRYRLRFLETKHLRYPLPYEAFIRIKEFEKQHSVEIKQFSIMAPAEAFKLEKKTDPLLFAHISNNKYYLLHRWGNDLSPYRKVLAFPLRNLYTLVASVLLFSLTVAFLLPKEWIVYDKSFYPLLYNFRLFLFFLLSTGSFAALFYFGITRNKSFSEDEWNSKWI